MNRCLFISLVVLLSISISGCQNSQTTQLESTNTALMDQINNLMIQLTQQAVSSVETVQASSIKSTESITKPESALPSPNPPSIDESVGIAPTLIFSGSGEITPFNNKTVYPLILFGSANVHMMCDPKDITDGKIWIDNKNYSINCDANSESWSPWKQDITVGDHYIYSVNPADVYEFWTIETPPFTIRNKNSHSDYMFIIDNPGIYNLTANLNKGEFNLYITCEGAQNYNYKVSQSTTIPVVLNPGRCELIIRDSPPGTITPGEIEVSLEFKQ